MQGIIAVEQNLTSLTDRLELEGYEVVNLDAADLATVDAVVISGADNNLMNMQDIVTDVPVINASGKTAEDILNELTRL